VHKSVASPLSNSFDLPGATPHPFVDPITHLQIVELLVLSISAIMMMLGLHGSYCFLSLLPCRNLTPAHPAARLDAVIYTCYYCFYSYSHYVCDVMLVSERRNEIRHEVPIT
jgi:hypothetical protein